jgi:hypothetical protein
VKFLIDECLSPKLAELAWERGHDASHIVWLGGEGTKDWDLIPRIQEGDWTFVTRNSVDFRGDPANPGGKGQYTRLELHAGLICLNAGEPMPRALQLELFERALDELSSEPELVNQVLEITLDGEEIVITRYDLPAI